MSGHDLKWKWIDPDQESHGVLLSDRIKFYVDKMRLIDPFDENSLNPASYNLHAGDLYYHNNKEKRADKNRKIMVPRNGLIYLRLREELNIPYYM
jgi:deoxycytidine triphosphate deaminase